MNSALTLKVMTFNIRNSDTDDGVNCWNLGRSQRALALINDYKPDIFGVQEATDGEYGLIVSDLKTQLPEYHWYGVGRDDGKQSGEHCGILYRHERFELLASGEYWNSATPDIPGTTFATCDMQPEWDCSVPRIASWVLLNDCSLSQQILVMNQHWAVALATHLSAAKLLRTKLAELLLRFGANTPVFIVGDFNLTDQASAAPYSMNPAGAYELILGHNDTEVQEAKLTDAYRSLHRVQEESELTFHEYHGGLVFHDTTEPEFAAQNFRIDYIFTSANIRCLHAEIIRASYSDSADLWPSDHYPVIGEFVCN